MPQLIIFIIIRELLERPSLKHLQKNIKKSRPMSAQIQIKGNFINKERLHRPQSNYGNYVKHQDSQENQKQFQTACQTPKLQQNFHTKNKSQQILPFNQLSNQQTSIKQNGYIIVNQSQNKKFFSKSNTNNQNLTQQINQNQQQQQLFSTQQPLQRSNSDKLFFPQNFKQSKMNSNFQNSFKNLSANTSLFNQSISTKISSSQKQIPKHIQKDKEKLYEENMGLKKKYQEQLNENHIIKAKHQSLVKEYDKLQKLIDEIENHLVNKNENQQKLTENLLIANYKKKLKDAQINIKDQEKQIQDFEKSSDFNTIKELEVQNKYYIQENQRLASIVESQTKLFDQIIKKMDQTQIEQKMQAQNILINEQEQQINKKNLELKLYSEEINVLQVQLQIELKKIKMKEKVIDQKNQQLLGKDKIIQNLHQQIQNISDEKFMYQQKAQKIYNEEEKFRELQSSIKNYQKITQDQQERILYQTKQMQDQERKLNEKYGNDQKEKRALQEELNKTRQIVEDQKQKIEILNSQQGNTTKNAKKQQKTEIPSINSKKDDNQLYKRQMMQNNFIDEANNSLIIPKSKQGQLQIFPVVKKQDIQALALELKMRLRSKKLTADNVLDWFVFNKNIRKKEVISIREILYKIKEDPFCIQDSRQALLLARYLVEDNKEDKIIFDEEMAVNLPTVRSRFRYLIGEFKLFTAQEDQYLHKILTQIVSKHRENIQSYLDQNAKHVQQTGKVTEQELNDTIKAIDIQELLNDKDIYDFLFIKLFEMSNTMDYFFVRDIYEIFKDKQTIEIKTKKSQRKLQEHNKILKEKEEIQQQLLQQQQQQQQLL